MTHRQCSCTWPTGLGGLMFLSQRVDHVPGPRHLHSPHLTPKFSDVLWPSVVYDTFCVTPTAGEFPEASDYSLKDARKSNTCPSTIFFQIMTNQKLLLDQYGTGETELAGYNIYWEHWSPKPTYKGHFGEDIKTTFCKCDPQLALVQFENLISTFVVQCVCMHVGVVWSIYNWQSINWQQPTLKSTSDHTVCDYFYYEQLSQGWGSVCGSFLSAPEGRSEQTGGHTRSLLLASIVSPGGWLRLRKDCREGKVSKGGKDMRAL